jgi:hypothetical protein
MDTNPAPRHSLSVEVEDKTYRGTYRVAGKILTVSTGLGGKSKLLGTMEPDILATQLLLELVKAGKT